MRIGIIIIILGCALLGGCAHTAAPEHSATYSREQLLDGHLLKAAARADVSDVDLLAVNDDMRAFLRRHVPHDVSDWRKIELILAAMLQNGLNLNYESLKTFTAREAFYRTSANCLSFSTLFVALAREAGLDARFQQVRVPPVWEKHQDLSIVNLHINVLVTIRGRHRVVDFNMEDFDEDYPRFVVSDDIALAQYHNNMSVHALLENDVAQAFSHLRRAIDLNPQSGYFWNNLGAVYRKHGNPQAAASAYLAAVQVNDEPVAMSNLARHYRRENNMPLAQYYEERVERFRQKNPFYLYDLALAQYDAAHYDKARDLLQRAIRMEGSQHEFHRLLGLSHLRLGDTKHGSRSLEQACKLAVAPEDKSRYSRKLRVLGLHQCVISRYLRVKE